MNRLGRAFSILEVAVAIAIIGVISGMITLAVTQAQMTSGNNRLERQVRSVVGSMVDQVAGAPYAQLVQGSFVRPEACSDDAKRSCTTVWGRDIEVVWSTAVSTDPDRVTITAVTETVKNRTVTLRRIVTAPAAGWSEGSALVRVTVSGDGYTGNLYVVDMSGSVLGDGVIDGSTAMITVPDGSCSSKQPCRLAINPAGGAVTGAWGIDAVTILGAAGHIVTSSGTTDVSAVITQNDRLTVKLLAENPDGRNAEPNILGSVCLIAVFNDGVASRHVERCNDTLTDRVVFSTYQPDPTRPQLSLAMPRGAAVTLALNSGDGSCPVIDGAKLYSDGEWTTTGTECTSWTWGTPSVVLTGTTETSFSSFTRVIDGAGLVTAVWSGSSARPAAGYDGQPLWSKPRDARSCAATGTCVAQSAPEPVKCPGLHCFSSARSGPQLVSLLTGSNSVYAVNGQSSAQNSFVLSINSPDASEDDTTVVELLTAPSSGSIKLTSGPTVLNGGTLTSFNGQDHSVPLIWVAPSGASATSAKIRMTNGNGSTDVTISLSTVTAPWLVNAEPVDIRQGESGAVLVTVIGTDGEVFPGAVVVGSGPAGVTVGTATTSSAGTASVDVSVAGASSGTTSIDFTASATVSGLQRTRSGSGVLFVRSAPSQLTLSATGVGTNGSGSVLVTAVDAAGKPARNAIVEFSVSRNGEPVSSVHARPGGCVTDTGGVCSVLLTADASALPGVYDITAVSGSTTGTGFFSVAASARAITIGRLSVAQGATASTTVTITDSAGSPLSGQTISVATPNGLSATTSGTTDSLGRAVISVTAASSATIGANTLTVSSGGVNQVGNVSVTAKINSIKWNASSMVVPTGSVVTVKFTAFDAGNEPAGNVSLTLTPDGIVVPSVVRTDRSGVATFTISVSAAAPAGLRSFAVGYDGSTVDVVSVSVVKGVAHVVATNTLVANGQSQSLTLRITDAAGAGIAGLGFELKSQTKGLALTKSTFKSGTDGLVTIPVTVRSDIAVSTSRLVFTALGKDYPVLVSVKG